MGGHKCRSIKFNEFKRWSWKTWSSINLFQLHDWWFSSMLQVCWDVVREIDATDSKWECCSLKMNALPNLPSHSRKQILQPIWNANLPASPCAQNMSCHTKRWIIPSPLTFSYIVTQMLDGIGKSSFLSIRITSSLFNCLRLSPWPSNAHYHFEFAATRPGKHAEAMMTSEEIHFAVILLANKLHFALFINGPMMPNVILFMELSLMGLPVCLTSHRLCHEANPFSQSKS